MFKNDYSEIGAMEVLEALKENMDVQHVGYGLDTHSETAEKLILKRFGLSEDEAKVHFLAGGTQTNTAVISYFLRPYEGVVACDTGHINVHETGSVEGSGHKVVTVPNKDGKATAEEIEKVARVHRDEHMVKLKMVYISDSTETGTVYTKNELLQIREVCDKYGFLLFLDGARLGVALTAEGSDVTAEFLASVCDVFYVGGTKNGALYGEAIVIKNNIDDGSFRHHIKNRCAMLAKGYVLGIQFERLFAEDDLYFELAKNSNKMAKVIRDGLKNDNVSLEGSSNTNQIFIRVNKKLSGELIEKYGLELWDDADEKTDVVRIVTSFATKEEECQDIISYINNH